jgi:putative endonuclease
VPTDLRRARGELGERFAERHLAAAGYRLLDRNFRTRYGELDLVAAGRRALVFCEVKTRVAGGRGPPGPLDGIGPDKRRRLRLMAAQWLAAHAGERREDDTSELRFDAIGVTLSPGGRLLALEHVEDAF